jgi:glycosyltransferase involved in cell wall biosynthesis
MRLSFLLSSLSLSGGVLLVLNYAHKLIERGYKIVFVVPGKTIDPEIRGQISPAIEIVECQTSLKTGQSKKNQVRLSLEMAQRTPHSDFVIATHTPTTVPGFLASRVWRKGRLLWLYMDYPIMFQNRPVEQALLRWMPKRVDGIGAISKPLVQDLSTKTERPLALIGSGLPRDELFYSWAKWQPRSDGSPTQIFYVGDDRPRKGLNDLLVAANSIHQHWPIHLSIASKQELVIQASLPYTLYLHPDDKALSSLYHRCDIFVSASWFEGLGYPPLEAMAFGRPVVTTDSNGVRDFALHKENAIIVPAQNPQALAAGIECLLENPELAAKLAQNGLKTARRYSWDKAADRFERLIASLMM